MEENKIQEISEENEGISLLDIWNGLKKNFKKVAIISAVIFLVSFFGIFMYGKSSGAYVANFQYAWPKITSDQLPDGSTFNFKDLISYDNLTAVKNSDEKFKDLDIEKMINGDSISISKKYIDSKLKEENRDKPSNVIYTLRFKQKYFNNSADAKDFAKKIIEDTQFDLAFKQINEYKMTDDFATQNAKTEYTEMISNIGSQIKLQRSVLDNLINTSSKHFVYDKETGKTLGDLKNEYESYLVNNDYTHFSYEMKLNNYVRNTETYKNMFRERKFAIEYEIEKNNLKIEALNGIDKNPGAGLDNIPQLIANYTLRNIDLQYELDYINSCLSSATYNEEFDKKVINYQNELKKFNTEIEKAYKTVNKDKISLNYSTNKIIEKDGIGFTKSFLFSIIIVAGFVFVYSIYLYLKK